MAGTARSPFDPTDLPETILLATPPLARVLVQVRFAPVHAVASEAFVGEFQQALADDYPIGSSDKEFAVTIAADGDAPPSTNETRLWRFETADGASRVTLATTFVAFETERYMGHERFFGDFRQVLDTVASHIRPSQAQRVGVRYFQRLTDDDLEHLSEYFRSELLGICGAPEAASSIDLCLTQARHVADEATLFARWGMLPAGKGTDLVPPVDSPSWVFDIDTFDEQLSGFDPAELVERSKLHSRRQYQFFRWAVEPAFLRRFGANNEQLIELEAMMSR